MYEDEFDSSVDEEKKTADGPNPVVATPVADHILTTSETASNVIYSPANKADDMDNSGEVEDFEYEPYGDDNADD